MQKSISGWLTSWLRPRPSPPRQTAHNFIAYDLLYQACQSPIERVFLSRAYACLTQYGRLEAQTDIGGYFADFTLTTAWGKFFIELDGHEYHHTSEQRRRDSARQNHIVARGWIPIRFTGSEIYGDVARCVFQAAAVVEGWRDAR